MDVRMRLATWNCQTGLTSNWDALERLAPDVVTVQECGEHTAEQAKEREGWTCEWQAGAWEKGLAVLAHAPYTISHREIGEPFLISTIIDGPVRFRFVAFWAMTPSHAKYSYTRQATRLIDALPDDGLPIVIAGDFNASKSSPHLANVASLGARDLVSAYHTARHLEHDAQEPEATSYFQWKHDRPYHMDFVFVPRSWHIDKVEVGGYEDYALAGLSDHVPVIAAVSLPPG
jgi:endonuclease/exonuclease/phosphatase family metal-dependent hydrolase